MLYVRKYIDTAIFFFSILDVKAVGVRTGLSSARRRNAQPPGVSIQPRKGVVRSAGIVTFRAGDTGMGRD